jgi:GNAT superfamily N-acetyltransferase
VTIRRPGPADLAALSGFFAALSTRSRVRRFFAPVRPTLAVVRLACGLAGPAGESPAAGTDALVATLGGVIIGHAMAADRPARPAGRPAPPEGLLTDIGVVVADAWQGQGVGSALVQALIGRAQARGVTSLSMDVLPGNQEVLAMIAAHWSAARTRRTADCVTIRAGLIPDPAPSVAATRTVPGPGGRRRELARRG